LKNIYRFRKSICL